MLFRSGNGRSMISRDLANALPSLVPEEDLFFDEPTDRHTTFRAGGRADLFVCVRTPDILRNLCLLFKEQDMPFLVIGRGSNLLVSDKGYHGALLSLTGDAFREIRPEQKRDGSSVLVAGAAATLAELSHRAADFGLAGYVPLSGIPGTIGGALTMNAGAYGGEMKDVVRRVKALDLDHPDLPELLLENKEMGFGYRTSIAKNRRLLFLSAELSADHKEDTKNLKEQMLALAETRKEKQPLDYPSAGSTFKRPAGAFAAKLIEEAGCKGMQVGGAQVSEKHAGFIVNKGSATATDILTLMRNVRRKVEAFSGIRLEPEVRLWGGEEPT